MSTFSRAFLGSLRQTALACLLSLLLSAAARPLLAQDKPVDSLDDAEGAVVLIEAVGTFVDPYEGTQQGIFGYGSGFLIDPSGLAITNNHVVTGGALYRVYVPGRRTPVNARVIGVSECADLALIDLAGSGYPWLEWANGRVMRGQEVFAAGYPGDALEYVLNDGDVQARNANGESDWASLDAVIAHDAHIEPGSSGGPLLNEDGEVVGVNYAYSSFLDEGYAIPAAVVLEILDLLMAEEDIDSLGINGLALDDRHRTGIWVASVATGSVADAAGLLPGDLIVEMEHVPVGIDGLMADYCDIVRSHAPGSPLQVKVWRESVGDTMEGQFNGLPLAQAEGPLPLQPGSLSMNWVEVSDGYGIVTFEAPDNWSQLTERDWVVEGRVVGRQLFVSSDPENFLTEWSVPGFSFSWSFILDNETTPQQLAGKPDYSEDCDSLGTELDGEPGEYEVFTRFYHGCDAGMAAAVVAMEDSIGGYVTKIEYYGKSEADFEAIDHIFATLDLDVAAAEAFAARDLRLVVDESGRVSFSVPGTWRDVVSEPLEYEGEVVGVQLTASTDMDNYERYWGYPGITVSVFDDLWLTTADVEDWLDGDLELDDCDYVGRYTHNGAELNGKYDLWERCSGERGSYYVSGLMLAGDGVAAAFTASLPDDSYPTTLETILNTLAVDGEGVAELQSPQDGAATATVLAGTLNIRSGPDTTYPVIGLAHRNEEASVLGQFEECTWLVVRLQDGREGWISGNPEYTSLSGRCADIPRRSAP